MHRPIASSRLALALIAPSLVCLIWTSSPARAQGASASAERVPPGVRLDVELPEVGLRARPRLSIGRLGGELVAGVGLGGALGLAGLMAGGSAGDAYFHRSRASCGACDTGDGREYMIGGAAFGVLAAYPLGCGLGVAWIGRAGDQTGSVGAAIGGAYLGALAGALVASLPPVVEDAPAAGAIAIAVGAPLGAIIAFNRTRAHDGAVTRAPARPRAGLVNVDKGAGARLSIPAVAVTRDPLRSARTLTSVRLVDGRF